MDLAIVKIFESFRASFLTPIFIFFTFLGEENIVVFLILIIYFAINKRLGEYLALTAFTSAALNGILKDIVRRPRPYMQGDVSKVNLKGFVNTELDNSYSFPSGHSQISAAVFGGIAMGRGKTKGYLFAAAAIILVMLSRVYLGVHYLSDCLAGAALGLVAAYFWKKIYSKHNNIRLLIFVAAATLLLFSLFFIRSEDSVKALGAMFGGALGVFLENKLVNFKVEQRLFKRVLRVALGGGLVTALRLSLKVILPQTFVFLFARYFLLILFMTFLYPLAFTKLKF